MWRLTDNGHAILSFWDETSPELEVKSGNRSSSAPLSGVFRESLGMNDTLEFFDVANSFYGCTIGNIDSPIWICGLEWGGGLSQDVPTPTEFFTPYGFEELQCLNAKDFENNFWDSHSPFCRAVIKILSVLSKDSIISWNSFADLEKEGMIGRDGLALVLNSNPLSFSGRGAAKKDWDKFKIRLPLGEVISFSEWTQCGSFDEYSFKVLKIRRRLFEEERKKRKPRIIVACGEAYKLFLGSDCLCDENLRNWSEIRKLFIPSMRISSRLDNRTDVWCTWLRNSNNAKEDTLLVWQNFPGRFFNSNSQFETTYKAVRQLYKEKMQCDWLETASDNSQSNSARLEEELVRDIQTVEISRSEIEGYKRQCSALLTTLEKLQGLESKDLEVTNRNSKVATETQLKVLEIYPKFNDQYELLNKIHRELCKRFCAQCGKHLF